MIPIGAQTMIKYRIEVGRILSDMSSSKSMKDANSLLKTLCLRS